MFTTEDGVKSLLLPLVLLSLTLSFVSSASATDKEELREALRKIERAEGQLYEAKEVIEDLLVADGPKKWSCNYFFPWSDRKPFKGDGDTLPQAKNNAITDCENRAGQQASACASQARLNGYMQCRENF